MDINKELDGQVLTIYLNGRLDTNTAPLLDAELNNSLDGITSLIFNFEKLDYISSAGLRTLLLAQKKMAKQGKMVIKNANDGIKDIFEITGFVDFLNIE